MDPDRRHAAQLRKTARSAWSDQLWLRRGLVLVLTLSAFGLGRGLLGPPPQPLRVDARPAQQTATPTPETGVMQVRGFLPITLRRDVYIPKVRPLQWESLPPYAGCARRMVSSPSERLRLYDLAEDGRGTLWFATDKGALGQNADGTWRSLTQEDGLAYDDVRSIGLDAGGNPWFGSSFDERSSRNELLMVGGITGYNYSGTDTWRGVGEAGGIAFGGVEDIAGDGRGGKWLVTDVEARSGVFVDFGDVYYLSNERAWTHVPTLAGIDSEEAKSVLVDAYENVWIDTYQGLVLKPAGGDWTTDLGPGGPSARFVRAMGTRPDRGEVWIVSRDHDSDEPRASLYRRGADAAWQHLPVQPDTEFRPETIGIDAKGNFFWGGEGGAGVRWADGRWESFPDSDLLGSRYISEIIADRSGLWFALGLDGFVHMDCP